MRKIAAALVVVLLVAGGAQAREMEKYCNTVGFSSALRQTIIIIDEHHITPEKGKKGLPENRDWRRFIRGLVDLKRTGISRDFLPRERVTLMVGRRDGGGLTTLFTGCLPLFSTEEKNAMGADRGSWKNVDDFFGWGASASIKKDSDRFSNMLARATIDVAREGRMPEEHEASVDFASGGIVLSLARSHAVDLTRGVPRIFLYSDLTRFDFSQANDVVSARRLGLALGEKLKINFDRAELYVLSSRNVGKSEIAREVLHTFFLQSRAWLMSFTGSASVSNLVSNPTSLKIFQGEVIYPNGTYPVRMRLAFDRIGNVVNSWISVQSDVERYTPFTGILTCKSEVTCKFIGDKVFAQVWTTNPDPKPEFEATMPFAGVRELAFSVEGDKISGIAFDSSADIKGTKDNKLRFELTRLEKGVY